MSRTPTEAELTNAAATGPLQSEGTMHETNSPVIEAVVITRFEAWIPLSLRIDASSREASTLATTMSAKIAIPGGSRGSRCNSNRCTPADTGRPSSH